MMSPLCTFWIVGAGPNRTFSFHSLYSCIICSFLDDYSLFEKPAASYELLAEEDGYIVANDAEKIGSASVLLGAGRQKKGDPLDFAAGITLHKKRGDYVHKGESLATFYGAADKFDAAAAEYRSGLVYGPEKPEEAPLVYALVTKDGVERY